MGHLGHTGIELGQLVSALDATQVNLVSAPQGTAVTVESAALIDPDDVRLGLSVSDGNAEVFFLLGINDTDTTEWIHRQAACHRAPTAIFIKEPSNTVITTATNHGVAVVAVEPKARWERLYLLVNHVFAHHGDQTNPLSDSNTDLFGLAQSIAERIHGMVSIEDAHSGVLAYSASDEEADELRRLSILGRAGPAEHVRWITQRGIFGILRSGNDVVRVHERPELGLRPRWAIGIHLPDRFAGTIWVQQGKRELAEDAEDILRGAAVLAARIMAHLAARPSAHSMHLHQVLGLAENNGLAITTLAQALDITADGRAAVIGFDTSSHHQRLPDVVALSASAFRADAQVAAQGSRIYVLLPDSGSSAHVSSWTRGTIATLRNELGVQLRAVIAAPVAGLSAVANARYEIDRVLDSAARHPVAISQVTTLAEARTTVLLDDIVTLIGNHERLIDPRAHQLREQDPVLAHTLAVYLDNCGDIATAARLLHVHPNTVRYRIRRIEKIMSTSLANPEIRLVLALSLRALA